MSSLEKKLNEYTKAEIIEVLNSSMVRPYIGSIMRRLRDNKFRNLMDKQNDLIKQHTDLINKKPKDDRNLLLWLCELETIEKELDKVQKQTDSLLR